MKKISGTYRKGKHTLPLEGGGRRVGVKSLTGVATNLRKYSTDTEQHSPHPSPLPCLRRSGFAQAGPNGEGR